MDKEYLIKKWLADELSEQELEVFKQLDDYLINLDIVENAEYFKASEFSTVDDFETFSKRIHKKPTPVRKLAWTKPFLRIAGVLILGLVIYYIYSFNNLVQIETLAGEKTTIELPDASVVVINAMSEIRYKKYNWAQKRAVNLNGEAFFDVAKGAKFDVITSEGTVGVLGTKFNIKQRDGYFEVKCFEGIVKVTSKDFSEELIAGDNFRIVNRTMTLGNNLYQQPQWTKNISSFQRTPFYEVIAELERQYSIEITIQNVQTERLFTGSFLHDNLEHALKSITEPLSLGFRIKTNKQVTILPSEK